MDANHFRHRAARAREMSTSGDDPRLSQMLLEVARDLEAEADAIDAENAGERRRYYRQPCQALSGSLIWPEDETSDPSPVQVIDISPGGARLQTKVSCPPGSAVVLDIPGQGLRLSGRIVRSVGLEAGMVFEPASAQDPALDRYLQLRCAADTTCSAPVG